MIFLHIKKIVEMNKYRNVLGLLLLLVAMCCCTSNKQQFDNYRIEDNVIVFDEPKRVEGQKSMLQFADAPIPTVHIGFIGLGMRGPDAVNRMTYIDGVEVVALCDLLPENVEGVQRNILEKKGLPRAAEYVGPEAYKELCERDDIDLVYICTGWQNHVEIAVYAMQQGKHVAVEVPAATSVE